MNADIYEGLQNLCIFLTLIISIQSAVSCRSAIGFVKKEDFLDKIVKRLKNKQL